MKIRAVIFIHWVKSLSHVRLCNPRDCNLPGSSVYGIFQARIPEWVAIFIRCSQKSKSPIYTQGLIYQWFSPVYLVSYISLTAQPNMCNPSLLLLPKCSQDPHFIPVDLDSQLVLMPSQCALWILWRLSLSIFQSSRTCLYSLSIAVFYFHILIKKQYVYMHWEV